MSCDAKQTYNLLDEKWIQCEINGHIQKIGLLELNRSVNKITNIIIPKVANNNFPFYELALYRFLIVLYSRAINVDKYDERDAQCGITEHEIRLVEQYLLKYQNKFDILNKDEPFLQCSEMESASILDTKPNTVQFVTSFVHLPSENAINSKTLIGYNTKENITCQTSKEIIQCLSEQNALNCQEVVYHLLYLNSFAKCAGAAGCSSISSTPELYIIFQGETLGQTLQMNLITSGAECAAPIWERCGILSYYNQAEPIDAIGHTFYPNRICRFEFDENLIANKLLYAPHNFKTSLSLSKSICKEMCEQYYQSQDRDALLKLKGNKITTIRYSRTENWLTMLMSAAINNGDNVESTSVAKEIFNGNILLPKQITIVLYGRSTDGKSGVYQYAEKLEENIVSALFKDEFKRAYVEKYIRFIRAQFVLNKEVVKKYYELLHKNNPHVENKVPFINQQLSTYAHKKLSNLYQILCSDVDVDEQIQSLLTHIRLHTKQIIMDTLSENLLCAAQAYNFIFGGKK